MIRTSTHECKWDLELVKPKPGHVSHVVSDSMPNISSVPHDASAFLEETLGIGSS